MSEKKATASKKEEKAVETKVEAPMSKEKAPTGKTEAKEAPRQDFSDKKKNRGQNVIRSRRSKKPFGRRAQQKTIDSKVVSIRRVTKVRAGAKRLRFSAFVIVGDRKGRVGLGLGRSLDTRNAIEKATKRAEKSMIRVPLRKGTIPHEVMYKRKSAKVLIKPAGPGTGVIAGSSVRSVMELCGVHNVLTKVMGANNPIENARCAYEALKSLKTKPITRRTKVSKLSNKPKSSKKK